MGKWLEAVKGGPSDASIPHSYAKEAVIAEMWPGRFVYASLALPKAARSQFKTLVRVCLGAEGDYVDESSWVSPEQTNALLEDLDRLWRVCSLQEFLPGVNGARVLEFWRGDYDPMEFEELIHDVRKLLKLAIENKAYLHFMI